MIIRRTLLTFGIDVQFCSEAEGADYDGYGDPQQDGSNEGVERFFRLCRACSWLVRMCGKASQKIKIKRKEFDIHCRRGGGN